MKIAYLLLAGCLASCTPAKDPWADYSFKPSAEQRASWQREAAEAKKQSQLDYIQNTLRRSADK
jgi:hypothetical protein